jgi:glycosyltransferase involved in cell wall biosynthesis
MLKNVYILTNTEIIGGNTAASARLLNYAKALALASNRVYLCSAISNTRLTKEIINEFYPNIFIVKNVPIIKKGGGFCTWLDQSRNLFFLLKYCKEVMLLIRQNQGENVVFLYPSTVSLFELTCLFFFKLLHKEKVYYEANEVRKYALFRSGNLKDAIFYVTYLKYFLVERSTRFYDGLIAISTYIEAYFKKYNKNIIRIPILSDATEKSYSSYPTYDRKLEKFRICFTGSISLKKESFDLLYKVLAKIKKNDIGFELHLYGIINKEYEELLLRILPEKCGIQGSIFYHGNIKSNEIIDELKKYHLLILPRRSTLQAKYGFSTKLSEYLVSGVPTLLTNVGDNKLYIEDNFNAFLVEPDNIQEMTEKIQYIIQNYNKCAAQIVDNAFYTAKRYFDYSQYSMIMSEFLS